MIDKQIKEILSKIVIIVDTNEQVYDHITDIFNKQGIKWIRQNLDYGDYSFIINGKSYEKEICIERKAHLEELSGNFGEGRERFEKEFGRANKDNAKMILMVEDGSYSKLMAHKYDTDMKVESYKASIFAFKARYGISFEFVESNLSAMFIYNTFRYWIREKLKNLDVAI
jgi:ERCC4-type nuclease